MTHSDYKNALMRHRLERANITLKDAHDLYAANGSPASIVNRSYYAMFPWHRPPGQVYAALALLAIEGKETSKHRGVLALFDETFVKTKIFPKEMSKILRKAFDVRQIGDYEDNANVNMEQAVEILTSAGVFIRSVEEKLLQEKKLLES